MTQSRQQIWSPGDELSRRSVLKMGLGGLGLEPVGIAASAGPARPIDAVWASAD